ncbi:MAG: GNAT family N-acetyltransferase [Ruminococcus sp.]|uniref:GNAT family N-acetyltransferase n=1 Tax=Ruminococcus sp. TaxID=41978 RepID=UPI0025F57D9D|nr:GNAT family N-acetyltransferase [Ruminococcus sp.]MBR5683830.1 GNAT family N-acetyltransferase [Ruminococcus sp.]
MGFLVHTLEYKGGLVFTDISPRNYEAADYEQYRRRYEDCFYPMRSSLGLPRECCKSSEELLKKRDNTFVLEDNGCIIGSVSVIGNEIDDLFVAAKYQRMGYGLKLLLFAISRLQNKKADKIILHAADVNKAALSMYLKNCFVITETEEINISL